MVVGNRIGLADSGTISTVSAISLADIKAFYQQYFSPDKSEFSRCW